MVGGYVSLSGSSQYIQLPSALGTTFQTSPSFSLLLDVTLAAVGALSVSCFSYFSPEMPWRQVVACEEGML